jgi:N-acetylmuramoyl-L-alanine amidase
VTRPLDGAAIEEQPEPIVVRMCLWAEARGEGPEGMLAVWWVIRNRSVTRVRSMKEEVLRPKQFSSFNPDDPNRAKLLTAYLDDRAGWSTADAVATLAEKGRTLDPTTGATSYYNPSICQPAWGRGHPGWHEHTTIGNHTFGVAA